MSNTLIGLGDVLNDLINLHNSNRLPNKLLLSGTQGIGKGVLSKHLLNYILSKNEPFEYDLKKLQINPSNKSYKLFESNAHPNVFKIHKKKDKKNIDISQIREMIKFQNSSSFNNKTRFVLIEDADLLNVNSINALLKSLEEPNNNFSFILTHNSNKTVLETLKSRCIEFKVNLKNEFVENIVNSYFSENVYNQISLDFKNYYHNPVFLINLSNYFNENNLDIQNFSIEDLLYEITINPSHLKDEFILSNLNLFIELYFYKNINAQKKNIFKAKEYFLKKLSNVKKYNLDIETFFLEFKDLLK